MPTEHCNRVRVERYFLGEISGEEKSAARLHLDGCPKCRGLMATMENDKRTYLLEHPFREFAAKRLPEGKAVVARGFNPRWMTALAGVAACLVLLPILFHSNEPAVAVGEDGKPAGEGIRTKGGTVLEYYFKRGDAVTPGSAAEPYRSGDELQFVYAAGGHPFVSLASIDARGHVSLYKAAAGAFALTAGAGDAVGTVGAVDAKGSVAAGPGQSDGAVSVKAPLSQPARDGEKQSLPFAVTLDDSPGSELFVMIYSAGPLDDEAVEGWLMEAFTRASGNLEALTSVLSPPPSPAAPASAPAAGPAATAGKSDIKTLLIRKTQA